MNSIDAWRSCFSSSGSGVLRIWLKIGR